MNAQPRRERRKQPIRRSVTSAIELYLGDLNGHKVNDLYHTVLNEVEPALINVVMHHVEGNQSQAAEILGISRGTLRKKLKQYNLEHSAS
jgi:Fis family transcriptional regulator